MKPRMRILGVRRFSRLWWRLLWARLNIYNRLFCWWVDASYWLRPYDMLADRRRWRWQSAQRCLGLVISPAQRGGEEENHG